MDTKRGRDSEETIPQDEATRSQDDEESRDATVERRESLQQQLPTSAAGSAGSQLPAGDAAPSHGSQLSAPAMEEDSASRSARDMTGPGETGRSGGRGRSSARAPRLFLEGPTRSATSGVDRNKRESEGAFPPDEASDSRVSKRTRVEGRGSSAAQRAAASEACKGITLEALQAQYYRPLSDVAKDLRVSVARLLKKCREFGIRRWPYRHVRSVQESIEQLERDRDAATDQLAAEEMDLRLRLLRRRGELVIHFASCGLEADMRKGIFLADPRDVDAMIAKAHEAFGSRRPPQGWDALGQFSDAAIREHFLEQMRAHMAGGGGMVTAPESPRDRGLLRDDPSGSVTAFPASLPRRQHIQHPQMYRTDPPHDRTHDQWHHPRQLHQQQPQHPWQGRNRYRRGDPQSFGPNYPSYRGEGSGAAAEMSSSARGGSGDVSRGTLPSAGDFARVRSPARAEYPPTSESMSAGYQFPPQHTAAPSEHTPPGQRHDQQHGAAPLLPSPTLPPIHPRMPQPVQRPDRRDVAVSEGWASPGDTSQQHPRGHSARHHSWRHPGRMTPPPHLGSATERWRWDSVDLASPSERGMPPGTTILPSIFGYVPLERPPTNFPSPAVAGSGSAASSVSSTTSRSGSRLPGVGEGPAVGIAGVEARSGEGADAGGLREPQWPGPFLQPPAGAFDHRWELPLPAVRRPSAIRSEGLTPPGLGRGSGGVRGEQPRDLRLPSRTRADSSSSAPPRSPGSRFVGGEEGGPGTGGSTGAEPPSILRDPQWGGPRVPGAAPPEGFERRGGYGAQPGSGRRASGGDGGGETDSQMHVSPGASRQTTWSSSSQAGSPAQQHGQEGGGSGGSRRATSSDTPRNRHC